MDTPPSSRNQIIILLISMGAHLFFLIIFLTFKDNEINVLAKLMPLDKQTNIDDAMILAQSAPNAQVLFQNLPEPEPVTQNKQPQEPAEPETDTTEEPTLPEPEPAPLAPTIISQPKEGPTPIPVEQEKKEKPKKKKKKKIGKQEVAAPMTFNQLSRAFLESASQEAGEVPKVQLDAEQLAHSIYKTKVWTLMRQSLMANDRTIHLERDVNTSALFLITLNKEGKLISAILEHPDKNNSVSRIELLLNTAAQKAGLFPPIPKQFAANRMTLKFPLKINGSHGLHTYELMYR